MNFEFAVSCRSDRWCATVARETFKPPRIGICRTSGSVSRITVDDVEWNERKLELVLTHELGHVVLSHTDADHVDNDASDIMRPAAAYPDFACTGSETAKHYREIYGPAAKFITLCGPTLFDGLPDSFVVK